MSGGKILILHGYSTNVAIAKHQFRYIEARLKKYEFVYINGYYEVPFEMITDDWIFSFLKRNPGSSPQVYQWFKVPGIMKFKEPKLFAELVKIYLEFLGMLEKEGPFVGIMGFSQGGYFLGSFLEYCEENSIKVPIKFATLFCSFKIDIYQKQIQIPSFHFVDKKDMLYTASLLSATQYKLPLIKIKSQGHKIPNLSEEEYSELIAFIEKSKKNKALEANL